MTDDSPTTSNGSSDQQQPDDEAQQHIVLFYKYHPLSSLEEKTEVYRSALERLCQRLDLKGRILVGCSDSSEGINGTLAGDYEKVQAFTHALLGREQCDKEAVVDPAVEDFWKASQSFFESISQPVLTMSSPQDFKWSRTNNNDTSSGALFPDLNIKLVKELIGTGGVLSSISLDETAQGYLTPRQWHDELSINNDDTILIDCRNTKECEIGRFQGALDPQTTTFSQFPKWVDDHKQLLQNKKVLMYCTGGIRCEKASAYVRRQVPSVQAVQHLKGGIHKYLEEVVVEGDSHWQGKNFVFHSHDVETTLGAKSSSSSNPPTSTTTVGQCSYCSQPYDRFDPRCVCTVCREPLLACQACQEQLAEFHCKQHFHLRNCYFTDLAPFSPAQLRDQLEELETLAQKFAVGKRFKQKRKTLNKQCDKIRQRLQEIGEDNTSVPKATRRCRNCDDPACEGKCWGFLGLQRKQVLEQQQKQQAKNTTTMPKPQPKKKKRNLKEQNKERVRQELERLKLSQPPAAFRDPTTGIRVPPPCTRILQTKMKGKWKGTPVLKVVRDEFGELAKPGVLERVLEGKLLKVNGIPVTMENGGVGLQTGDTISRIVRWHEPPVLVPEKLGILKVPLPEAVRKEFDIIEEEDAVLYVCNKPSTVPVHPAGPYLANSLTMMAEAQEGLPPQALNPCHRTDRVTSGLTICCTSSKAASVVQKSMCEKQIQKLYLARVAGKFCAFRAELESVDKKNTELVKVTFLEASQCVRVDAPIETVDPANGVRKITDKGKEASSLFRLISYDPKTNLSILCCRPITGRSHQLRVHLQQLGHPIVGDVLYGGQGLANDGTAKAAVEALLKSTTTSNLPELRGQSVSEEDAETARKACILCRPMEEGSDAARNYYTPAQLLESGHAIDLHASRYRIAVLPKSKKADAPKEPIGVLELRVDNPEWSGMSPTEKVGWLEES